MAASLIPPQSTAQEHARNQDWGSYRNARYETAERLREEAGWPQAGPVYLEVMILDRQGATNVVASADAGFDDAYAGPSPVIARKVARYSAEEGLDTEALRQVFRQVADQCWRNAFPRDRRTVWAAIRREVARCQQSLYLDRKVEALSPGEMLPPEDAERYRTVKDDYTLLARTNRLLDGRSPPGVPPEKQERVFEYLAAIDLSALHDRSRAVAYRNAGVLTWARGDRNEALSFFEKALSTAPADKRTAIEQKVRRLRNESGP